MRFLKGIFLFGITIALCPPATAVTKCVKLRTDTSCSSGSGSDSNWSANCGDVSINGVAICGSETGYYVGTTSESVTASTTSNANKYCWCKMVSPAVSPWVFRFAYSSETECFSSCAGGCFLGLRSTADFRVGMFSNLSD